MRYRTLGPGGDFTFGRGAGNFLVDSPQTVGQSVLTRLRLWRGEWWPYLQEVLGKNTQPIYDTAIRQRVLATQGVTGIQEYKSTLGPDRKLVVSMLIDTQFGPTSITTAL
jgi:hypothetical protein